MSKRVVVLAAVAALFVLALGAGGASAKDVRAGAGGQGSAEAKKPKLPATKWLCRPGLPSDPCRVDLTTTVDRGFGDVEVSPPPPPVRKRRNPVDCFYVYPTVSSQPTTNATKAIDPEVAAIANWQASRFSSICDVYAPVYRQLTLVGITNRDGLSQEAVDMAYSDVKVAWRNYMSKFNRGRGVILIGHSQGAGILTQLAQESIDDRPRRRERLVSAMIIGGNVVVPRGRAVGGDFDHIRACSKRGQTGCVIAYSAFSNEPPEGALFGRVDSGYSVEGQSGTDPRGYEVMCVNPASLSGGTGMLDPFFFTAPFPGTLGAVTGPLPKAGTNWVRYPGLYRATCRHGGDGSGWLDVDDVADPNDGRTRVVEVLGPSWGMHVAEVNLGLGNLVRIGARQAERWVKRSSAR